MAEHRSLEVVFERDQVREERAEGKTDFYSWNLAEEFVIMGAEIGDPRASQQLRKDGCISSDQRS